MLARVATLEQQGKTVVVLGQPNAAPAALLALRDQIRPEAAAALQELNQLGLQSIMLTGDNPAPPRRSPASSAWLARRPAAGGQGR